jgi:hypothetical protein
MDPAPGVSGVSKNPEDQTEDPSDTISEVCFTDWQKKDSAFLSSVAFL